MTLSQVGWTITAVLWTATAYFFARSALYHHRTAILYREQRQEFERSKALVEKSLQTFLRTLKCPQCGANLGVLEQGSNGTQARS